VRILMISDFYHPYVGGVEQHVRSLSHALAARGHEILVATLAHGDLPAYEWDGEVRVVRIRGLAQRLPGLHSHSHRPWAPPASDPLITVKLARVERRFLPDVVHGHDWMARSYVPLKVRPRARFVMSLHYYTASCAKKTLMYRGAPCSGSAPGKCLDCSLHHYGTPKGALVLAAHRFGSIAERRVVDRFIGVSEAAVAGNELGEGAPVEVVPNFIPNGGPPGGPVESFLDMLPESAFLLFVGDFRADKGLDVLLEAYRRLASPPPLVLIGKTWPESPVSFPQGVLQLGEWPHEAVLHAWRRCTLALVPSVWAEPFGLVVIEAMQAGRPVIATCAGGIPEIIVDGDSGLLVPPNDVDGLSAAISRLLADDGLRERIGARAREASRAFEIARIVPRIERIYDELVSGASA
jgi:glycosyltransferase involved in cell wall biosynthesis